MTAVMRFFKVAYGTIASSPASIAPTPTGNLFIPSGSDSLITSDSLTFNHNGA